MKWPSCQKKQDLECKKLTKTLKPSCKRLEIVCMQLGKNMDTPLLSKVPSAKGKGAKSVLASHQHHRLLTLSQLLIDSQSERTTVKS